MVEDGSKKKRNTPIVTDPGSGDTTGTTTRNKNNAEDAPPKQRDSAAETTGNGAASEASDPKEQAARVKRKGGEVDELFGKLKKASKPKIAEAPGKKPAKRKKAVGSKEDIFGSGSGKARRKDADGLTIYTEDDLKVGKGGNTPLCPFDCECCF